MDVYLLEVEGRYKIGISENIKSRIKDLQAANPADLSLIHSFATDQANKAEKLLHIIFKNKRIRNEWFALSASDIAFIMTINGFSGGSFTWTTLPDSILYANKNTRSLIIFKFFDYKGREFSVTERQIFEFLQVAWKRQQDKVYPLSCNWWTTQRQPRLRVAHYEGIMKVLVNNSIVINRYQGSSGILSMSPQEAMRIVTSPNCKDLTIVQRI